jgi:hypothetical protein
MTMKKGMVLIYMKLSVAEESAQHKNGVTELYNPWPSYVFTGKLRPYQQVCAFSNKTVAESKREDMFSYTFCDMWPLKMFIFGLCKWSARLAFFKNR